MVARLVLAVFVLTGPNPGSPIPREVFAGGIQTEALRAAGRVVCKRLEETVQGGRCVSFVRGYRISWTILVCGGFPEAVHRRKDKETGDRRKKTGRTVLPRSNMWYTTPAFSIRDLRGMTGGHPVVPHGNTKIQSLTPFANKP